MTFIPRPASTLDLFQDIGGANRPNEGLGVFIVAVDVISNDYDEFFEIAKNSTPQAVLRGITEENAPPCAATRHW